MCFVPYPPVELAMVEHIQHIDWRVLNYPIILERLESLCGGSLPKLDPFLFVVNCQPPIGGLAFLIIIMMESVHPLDIGYTE